MEDELVKKSSLPAILSNNLGERMPVVSSEEHDLAIGNPDFPASLEVLANENTDLPAAPEVLVNAKVELPVCLLADFVRWDAGTVGLGTTNVYTSFCVVLSEVTGVGVEREGKGLLFILSNRDNPLPPVLSCFDCGLETLRPPAGLGFGLGKIILDTGCCFVILSLVPAFMLRVDEITSFLGTDLMVGGTDVSISEMRHIHQKLWLLRKQSFFYPQGNPLFAMAGHKFLHPPPGLNS